MVPNHATRVRIPAGAPFYTARASMAEWSKALDLSSSIRKNAWVRTPLEAPVFGARGGFRLADPRITGPDGTHHSVLVA